MIGTIVVIATKKTLLDLAGLSLLTAPAFGILWSATSGEKERRR